MRGRAGRRGRPGFAPLLLRFPVLLNNGLTLLRSHLMPLAFERAPLFLRSLPKLFVLLAHTLLLLGGQTLELSPALAQLLPLFGGHRPPLTEALLCARPLLRSHRQPAVAALGERLLPVRGQARPAPAIALQHLLLRG